MKNVFIDKKLRKSIETYQEEYGIDIIMLNNPTFDSAIVGLSDDNRLIYDFKKMVEEMVERENISDEEATDFIAYNVLNAIPYFENSPIIIRFDRNEIIDYGER